MQTIPIQATANQTISIALGSGASAARVGLNVFTRSTGVYVDVLLNNEPLVLSRVALDRVAIIRAAYLGFPGDLAFMDLQGTNAPQWEGFGTRYVLCWLQTGDPGTGAEGTR